MPAGGQAQAGLHIPDAAKRFCAAMTMVTGGEGTSNTGKANTATYNGQRDEASKLCCKRRGSLTCGGFMMVRFFSPVSSGLFSRKMPNTLSACTAKKGSGRSSASESAGCKGHMSCGRALAPYKRRIHSGTAT